MLARERPPRHFPDEVEQRRVIRVAREKEKERETEMLDIYGRTDGRMIKGERGKDEIEKG